MAAAKDTINIKVKYTPDTSAMKTAMSGFSGVNFGKIKGADLKKQIAPVQDAIKALNSAASSGADGSIIEKSLKNIDKAVAKSKQQINSFQKELNAAFNSAGNQKLLKDLEEVQMKLKKAEKATENWTKKFGKESMASAKKASGANSLDDARQKIKDIEKEIAGGKRLNAQEEKHLENLREYNRLWEERQKNPKKELDAKITEHKTRESEILGKVILEERNIKEVSEMNKALNVLDSVAEKSRNEMTALASAAKTQEQAFKESKKEAAKFGDVLTGTFLGSSLSNLFQDALQKGVQFFKEYDETLTRTMMVTGMTRDEVNGLTSSYSDLANQLKSTTKDVAAAQLVFYQQGLGTSDAMKMTEASLAIAKTGGIEAGEAADRLTAAVKGYQMAAGDAMNIADKMSALDAAAASSVDELTVAMQKSASQANMAGLSLDSYMAYLSTMQEVTREAPENIGTAMKSITSRMQEISDIGKVEEDGTTFNNVAKALNSIGISAVDATGTLRPLQEIFDELGPQWASLDRNHQAYVATVLAGNRQQSRFIALMDNYDRALELTTVSQNAAGESAKQLRAYDEGLEASFVALNNAWQQFATSIADSSAIKAVVDLLTSLVETVNRLPDGLIQAVTLFKGFSVGMNTFKAVRDSFANTPFSDIFGLDDVSKQFITSNKHISSWIDKVKAGYKAGAEFSNVMADSVEKIDANSAANVRNTATNANVAKAVTTTGAAVAGTTALLTQNAAENIIADDSTEKLKIEQDKLERQLKETEQKIRELNKAMTDNDIVYDREVADVAQLRAAQAKGNQKIGSLDDYIADLEKTKPKKTNADWQMEAYTKTLTSENAELFYNKNQTKEDTDFFVEDFDKKQKSGLIDTIIGDLKEEDTLKTAQKAQELREKDLKKEQALQKELKATIEDKNEEIKETIRLQSLDITESDLEREIALEDRKLEKLKQQNDASGQMSLALDTGTETKEQRRKRLTEKALEKKAVKEKKKVVKESIDETLEQTTVFDIPAVNKKAHSENWKKLVGGGKDQKQTNFQNIGKVLKGSEGIATKAGKTFGELSKSINMTTVAGGFMAGTMSSMITEAIGLDGALGSGINTTATLMPMLSKFGPYGIAAAVGIGALTAGFKTLYPSVEEVQAELQELNSESDALKQTKTDIETSLNVYTELSNKLNKTEEEQSQLNTAVASLSKEVPGAVRGYDSMGNAILDLTKVTEELNNVQEKLIKNAESTLKTFNKLQKAEGSNGWTIAGDVLSGLEYVTNLPGKLLEDITGTSLTFSGLIQEHLIEPKELEGRKKVWAENFDEIYGNMQTIVADTVDNGAAKNEQLREKISNSILSNFSLEGLEKGLKVEEVEEKIKELYDSFSYGDLDSLVNITERAKTKGEISDSSWAETRDDLTERIEKELSHLDLSDEEFDIVLDSTLNISFAGTVNVGGIIDTLNKEIEKTTNNKLATQGTELISLVDNLSPAVVQVLDEMGLLNLAFADFFGNFNTVEEVENIFKGANGEIDKTKGSLFLLNKAYEDFSADQGSTELDNLNEEKANIEAEIKKLEEQKKTTGYQGSRSVGYYQTPGQGYENNINNNLALTTEITKQKEALEELNVEIKETEEQTKTYKDVVDGLIASFEGAEAPTFETMSESIKGIKAELEQVQDLASNLDLNSGKMNLDSTSGLFDILSSYEDVTFSGNAEMVQLWASSLDKINSGLSYQNGQLVAQESLMVGLNELTQVSAKMQIDEMKAKIDAQRLEVEIQNEILKTQVAAIDATIAELEAKGKAADAEGVIQEKLGDLDTTLNANAIIGEVKKNNTLLTYTSQAAAQYSKIWAAAKQGTYDGEFEELEANYSKIFEGLKSDMGSEILDVVDPGDISGSIKALKEMKNGLQNQIAINDKIISNSLEIKNKIADYLTKDTTNLAALAKDAESAQSDYNGKLERTLTLLEKIAGIQHTMDENESFKSLYDGYDGESYGRILASNLQLSKEEYEVQKDLFAMRQEMTNQAAGDLLDSPYGDLFTIAENGDLGFAENGYNAYKALSGEMQEDIDGLVDAYQEERDALRDTEKELIGYAEATKAAREEIVEMEIEVENELLEAIKNREKIFHDARMKALDDEISMIDEAVEARNRARDEDEQESDLFQAQEALRRATLDSSGKNNASLLQLQQDLEDKQIEISEKRFDQDMEDRKNWLQDTKDAETETYEYRLETMTWYWEQVAEIQALGQEEMMNSLKFWNEEYRKTSEIQQGEMAREWTFTMEAMQKATDMGMELDTLTSDITNVTSSVENMNIKIQALPGSWQKATDGANAYSAAASAASKYSGGSGNWYTGNNTLDTDSGEGETEIHDATSNYSGWIGQKVEFRADNKTIKTYNANGTKRDEAEDPWLSDPNVKVQNAINIPGIGEALQVDEFNGYIPVKYFYTTGWGGKKIGEKYANGGIVDYTGPAWVDGTKSKPEAFLNPYQTQQIASLAKSLSGNAVNNATMNSSINFGSVNFNVASMSSSADGRKALETFVQGANDLMAKKGIGTKLNLNVK